MPRIFQALLVLALLALSPALAQSSPAAQPARAVLVLPIGVELSDAELAEVEGKWFWAAIGASMGAAQAVRECGCEGWRAVGAAASGAAIGVIGGAKGELAQVAWNAAKELGSKVGQAAVAAVGSGIAWKTDMGASAVGEAWNPRR